MSKEIDGAVEWRPQWEGEQLEKFERMRAAYAREMSVMRAIRKALDLSQVDVARILEMTQSNVSKLERGDPALSVLCRMADAKKSKLTLTLTKPDGEQFAIAL